VLSGVGVLAYLASTPPVEDADATQHSRVVEAVRARFDAEGGRLQVSKDTGLFVCHAPTPPSY